MQPSNYIEQTGKAVEQLFDGLAFYQKILEDDPMPAFVSSVGPDDKDKWNKEYVRWHREHQAELKTSLEKQKEYMGYKLSQGTLAGAILQIACMGISLFSKSIDVPPAYKPFVDADTQAKFCIGRIICDLPIGIVILAARNQYNHWDDPKPRKLTVEVFKRIANASGKYTDPAFDLENPMLQAYSYNVLWLLGWRNYEAYRRDIETLLS